MPEGVFPYDFDYEQGYFGVSPTPPPEPEPEPAPKDDFGICTCCQDVEVQGAEAVGCVFCQEDGREGPVCVYCQQNCVSCKRVFCHRHGQIVGGRLLCRGCIRQQWGGKDYEANYDYCPGLIPKGRK